MKFTTASTPSLRLLATVLLCTWFIVTLNNLCCTKKKTINRPSFLKEVWINTRNETFFNVKIPLEGYKVEVNWLDLTEDGVKLNWVDLDQEQSFPENLKKLPYLRFTHERNMTSPVNNTTNANMCACEVQAKPTPMSESDEEQTKLTSTLEFDPYISRADLFKSHQELEKISNKPPLPVEKRRLTIHVATELLPSFQQQSKIIINKVEQVMVNTDKLVEHLSNKAFECNRLHDLEREKEALNTKCSQILFEIDSWKNCEDNISKSLLLKAAENNLEQGLNEFYKNLAGRPRPGSSEDREQQEEESCARPGSSKDSFVDIPVEIEESIETIVGFTEKYCEVPPQAIMRVKALMNHFLIRFSDFQNNEDIREFEDSKNKGVCGNYKSNPYIRYKILSNPTARHLNKFKKNLKHQFKDQMNGDKIKVPANSYLQLHFNRESKATVSNLHAPELGQNLLTVFQKTFRLPGNLQIWL